MDLEYEATVGPSEFDMNDVQPGELISLKSKFDTYPEKKKIFLVVRKFFEDYQDAQKPNQVPFLELLPCFDGKDSRLDMWKKVYAIYFERLVPTEEQAKDEVKE